MKVGEEDTRTIEWRGVSVHGVVSPSPARKRISAHWYEFQKEANNASPQLWTIFDVDVDAVEDMVVETSDDMFLYKKKTNQEILRV